MKCTANLTKLIYDNGKVYYRIDWEITETYLFGLIKSVETVQDKLLFETEYEARLYAAKALMLSRDYYVSTICIIYIKLDNGKILNKYIGVIGLNSIDNYYIPSSDFSLKDTINSNQFKEEKV